MAFPNTDLISTGKWRQQDWWLRRRDEHSRQADGIVRALSRGVPLWCVTVATPPMEVDDALDIEALINAQDGATNPFYWGDLRRRYPKAHISGAFTDSGQIATVPTAVTLTLKSLPAAFTISRGDYFHLSGEGGLRTLHQVVTGATADGSGDTTAIEVRPALPSFAAADLAVTFKTPMAKFLILPGSFTQSAALLHTEISFQAIQTY